VAPWGEILAEAENGAGLITATIDPARVAEARRAVPSLAHDRPFTSPAADPVAAE
jgi:deaminated glutathione amidase